MGPDPCGYRMDVFEVLMSGLHGILPVRLFENGAGGGMQVDPGLSEGDSCEGITCLL